MRYWVEQHKPYEHLGCVLLCAPHSIPSGPTDPNISVLCPRQIFHITKHNDLKFRTWKKKKDKVTREKVKRCLCLFCLDLPKLGICFQWVFLDMLLHPWSVLPDFSVIVLLMLLNNNNKTTHQQHVTPSGVSPTAFSSCSVWSCWKAPASAVKQCSQSLPRVHFQGIERGTKSKLKENLLLSCYSSLVVNVRRWEGLPSIGFCSHFNNK